METNEILTISECAEFLRRSRATLYEYMRRMYDPIPFHRPGERGHALFIKKEVVEWLSRQ